MRQTRPDQPSRSADWRWALRSAARGAGTAAAAIATYLCGLAALALIGALVLAAVPPDVSALVDSIDKTIAYTDAGALGSGDASRADPAAPETTGSIAAPDTAQRASAPSGPPCRGYFAAQDDSACGAMTARTGTTTAGDAPQLRGRL
ncbi:hypothetical protein [Bradyrhizobium sp. 2TAF24]|uniref:hypothetical protein n=1 Tax=Bradyrhizobium sp. 2TAF24 TaxID=3233011 RepID=UPI003F9092D3